jgi:hypothetical protein
MMQYEARYEAHYEADFEAHYECFMPVVMWSVFDMFAISILNSNFNYQFSKSI